MTWYESKNNQPINHAAFPLSYTLMIRRVLCACLCIGLLWFWLYPRVFFGSESTGRAEFMQQFIWDQGRYGLGGFSGLIIDDFGHTMIALSDNGVLVKATIERTNNGRIANAHITNTYPLRGLDGRILHKDFQDAEGIARAPDNRLYISFEGTHRILMYTPDPYSNNPMHAAAQAVLSPPFQAQGHAVPKPNKSLEALAISNYGAVFTWVEATAQTTYPVYRYADGHWDNDLHIIKRGAYMVVGADFDDAGNLYILERHFSFLHGGTRSRVRRFRTTATGLDNEQVVLETDFGVFDNLEGISLWRTKLGVLCMTLISDDNNNFLQRTELIEYCL